jgi:CxxC motif-containing protein (DUF1111 family)
MRRITTAAALTIILPACDTASREAVDPLAGLTLINEDRPDTALPGLSDDWQVRFDEGDAHFERVFRDSTGLGPNYIRHACASCHASDGRGPGFVRKAVYVEADGVTPMVDQSAMPYGPTVRPQVAGGATEGTMLPGDRTDLLISTRNPPAVFGRGYMEAIADTEIERLEADQALRDDGISGRINWVEWISEVNTDTVFHSHQPGDRLIGRFGLKARQPTLDDFTADAYQGDMGITSPMRPHELPVPGGITDDAKPGTDLTLEVVNLVADYVRLLAIPQRAEPDATAEALFAEVRCDVCHVPSVPTRADYPIPLLAGINAPVFTDLLLHDMGVDHADGLIEWGAGSTEWRTAPLMGLRFFEAYLHDGRAETINEAILGHRSDGSEANDSVDRYEALSAEDRARLLTYVLGL